MSEFTFSSVKILDPLSNWNGKLADVRISEGRIEKIAKAGSLPPGKNKMIGQGGVLTPGWVDMRVHLTDPGAEWKDDISSLVAAAKAGGFTRIVCLPNTQPPVDNRDAVLAFNSRAANQAIHLHITACLTEGAEGKDMAGLFDMHKAGAIAFTDGARSVQDSGVFLRALQYLKPFNGLLMHWPLDRYLSGGAQLAESPVSVKLGMKGIPAIAEELMVARDLKLLDYFEGRLHLGPVTIGGSVAQIRNAKKKYKGLSSEASFANLCFSDEELLGFDPNWKLKPPLRPKDEVKALRKALADGTLDVISSGHNPQALEDKLTDFSQALPGMTGLETCGICSLSYLEGKEGITLDNLVYALSHNPRRICGFDPAPIEVGASAELTHLVQSENIFTEDRIFSRSVNNPLIGKHFSWKVVGLFAKNKYYKN